MHIRRFHTHLYYIKRGVVIKKYVIVVSFQLYTIHILKFFFTYFKRVCPDHPIKLLMLFLFMFSVEGHTEHYTETRREIISYKTLITHWNHDWCEYIDDFFIFYFHFKSFNLLIVAVMMKHCRFCEQQAWRLDVSRTCITRHVSCHWSLSWDFFLEIMWYTDWGWWVIVNCYSSYIYSIKVIRPLSLFIQKSKVSWNQYL